MKLNNQSLFWGILLIGAGILALTQQMGYIDVEQFSPLLWTLIFAAIGLLGFLSYALSGWKEWGWLFPAGIFGGLAVTIWLATSGLETAAVATPLFVGLLIPFAVVYFMDRVRNWWALIPGGVMVFLALVTLLADSARGEWIGALLFFMIAISFLVVYLSNRTRIWALIVAYATGVLGLAPILAIGGETAAYFGPIFLFAIAIPFFVLYFRSRERWWAIIPAGALTTVAVIAAFAIVGFIESAEEGAYTNAVMMGGLAGTFAVVWLRNSRQWAKVVTIILALLAVASLFFVSYYQVYWPVAIILAGGYLLFKALRPKAA